MMEKFYKLNRQDVALGNIGVGSHMLENSCKYSVHKYVEDYKGFNVKNIIKYNTEKKLAVMLNSALYLIMPKKAKCIK